MFCARWPLKIPSVKVIVNARNVGPACSGLYALLQAEGDAIGGLNADLQDPPEVFVEMIREWEKGFPIVAAIKNTSDESSLMYRLRTAYYRLVARLTNVQVMEHFTGFGLYDRSVVEKLRTDFPDPYPFFRGMIAELGLPVAKVFYNQRRRERGTSKNNLYALYDLAMLGITNLSKVPLRLVIFFGFISAFLSFLAGMFYLVYKLVFWRSFTVSVAPLVLGLFFLGSVQLISLGIIGEYVGFIHTLVLKRPLVTERENQLLASPSVNLQAQKSVPQFVRYILVGGFNTVFGYGLFAFLNWSFTGLGSYSYLYAYGFLRASSP